MRMAPYRDATPHYMHIIQLVRHSILDVLEYQHYVITDEEGILLRGRND